MQPIGCKTYFVLGRFELIRAVDYWEIWSLMILGWLILGFRLGTVGEGVVSTFKTCEPS